MKISLILFRNNVVVHFKCYNANGDEIKPNAYQNSQEFVNSNIGILRIQLKNIKRYTKIYLL